MAEMLNPRPYWLPVRRILIPALYVPTRPPRWVAFNGLFTGARASAVVSAVFTASSRQFHTGAPGPFSHNRTVCPLMFVVVDVLTSIDGIRHRLERKTGSTNTDQEPMMQFPAGPTVFHCPMVASPWQQRIARCSAIWSIARP